MSDLKEHLCAKEKERLEKLYRKVKGYAALRNLPLAPCKSTGKAERAEYRQVVPSPKPVDVIEKNTVRALINGGCVVITVGGGGIPVVRRDGKLYGTPAVIDKDFASAKLAELVQADALVILTAVDRVCINWGKPDQKSLAEMTVAEAERYCEEAFTTTSLPPL